MSVCVGTQPFPPPPLDRPRSLRPRAGLFWPWAGQVRVVQKRPHLATACPPARTSDKTGGLLEARSPRHPLTDETAFGPALVFPGLYLDIKVGGCRERVCCPRKRVQGQAASGTGLGVAAGGGGARGGLAESRGVLGFPRLLPSVPEAGWRGLSPERREPGDAGPGPGAGVAWGSGLF